MRSRRRIFDSDAFLEQNSSIHNEFLISLQSDDSFNSDYVFQAKEDARLHGNLSLVFAPLLGPKVYWEVFLDDELLESGDIAFKRDEINLNRPKRLANFLEELFKSFLINYLDSRKLNDSRKTKTFNSKK